MKISSVLLYKCEQSSRPESVHPLAWCVSDVVLQILHQMAVNSRQIHCALLPHNAKIKDEQDKKKLWIHEVDKNRCTKTVFN